jgi:hypothetical protein
LSDCEKVNFENHSVDDVIKKILSASHGPKGKQVTWTGQELRILSYFLVKLQQDKVAYKYALSLLYFKWKNLFFNGVVSCVLSSWNELIVDFRKDVCSLIVSKLQDYTGNIQQYKKMKIHADYFVEAGPQRLSALLRINEIKLQDAPTVFGNKQSTLSHSYYSDVIIDYYKNKRFDFSELENVFQVHSNPRTKKLVFANLVHLADAEGDSFKQSQLCNFIERMLGNVTINATWAPFLGASDEEIAKLKNAQRLVMIWQTKRIIETFFELCVTDIPRKKFWLNYVQYVEKFKVIGSLSTKLLLESDPRIENLNRCFIRTNSKASQTSALVLCMKDRVIVEFSNVGAVYIYKKINEKVRFLLNGDTSINSIEDLKSPSMITNDYSRRELRMIHNGDWQNRLSYWLRLNILNNSIW